MVNDPLPIIGIEYYEKISDKKFITRAFLYEIDISIHDNTTIILSLTSL